MKRIQAPRFLLVAMGICALSLCVANVRVHAAYDAYLKIEGLDGGSKDPAHMGWIAVARVASGNLNAEGSGAAGREMASGQASGKRMHKPFVIVKELDRASPKLMQACSTGKHFSWAVIDSAGVQYKLYDVVIASVQRDPGGDRPMESVTLNYTKIEVMGKASPMKAIGVQRMPVK
jgi:type VI secretion system secreted protein Hcp